MKMNTHISPGDCLWVQYDERMRLNRQRHLVEKGTPEFRSEKGTAGRLCPECGSPLIPESGCAYCRTCGFSFCHL